MQDSTYYAKLFGTYKNYGPDEVLREEVGNP